MLKKKLEKDLSGLFSFLCMVLMVAYRTIGTPFVGGCCRFSPSCSEYALVSFHRFGFLQALKFIFKRLIKCRPGGGFGYDPIPIRGELNGSK